MAYLCSDLITRAYYLSEVVARDFETVSGGQATDGLFLLNALLEIKAAKARLIPYFRRYALTLNPGQEEYFITGLLQIETFTFNIGDVRYPTNVANRTKYFGNGRVNNITSLPFQWHAEREKDGTRLYVYYSPATTYQANITGKFGLTNVTLFTDLTVAYDEFYIEYLRYALAKYICQQNSVVFPSDKNEMLREMEKEMAWVSPPDLTMQKVSFINNKTTINWAQANLGLGWVP